MSTSLVQTSTMASITFSPPALESLSSASLFGVSSVPVPTTQVSEFTSAATTSASTDPEQTRTSAAPVPSSSQQIVQPIQSKRHTNNIKAIATPAILGSLIFIIIFISFFTRSVARRISGWRTRHRAPPSAQFTSEGLPAPPSRMKQLPSVWTAIEHQMRTDIQRTKSRPTRDIERGTGEHGRAKDDEDAEAMERAIALSTSHTPPHTAPRSPISASVAGSSSPKAGPSGYDRSSDTIDPRRHLTPQIQEESR